MLAISWFLDGLLGLPDKGKVRSNDLKKLCQMSLLKAAKLLNFVKDQGRRLPPQTGSVHIKIEICVFL
jgi:hypothetical protein